MRFDRLKEKNLNTGATAHVNNSHPCKLESTFTPGTRANADYTAEADGKNIQQILMPVLCLSIFPIASTARQTRSSMLEVMRQDYVRTAWAKGLKERAVVVNHALKNGLIPVVTLSGMGLSIIVGGSVLIETVFNIQGVGQMLVTAVNSHDYPVVQGFILFIAAAVLFINLLVDISYAWLDPRIRYD